MCKSYENEIIIGNVFDVLPKIPYNSVQCCVTSPPYWNLRDYKVKGQIGIEKTPEEYVEKLVNVFREVKRILKDDGTLWLILGDSYSNCGNKKYDPTGKTKTGIKNYSAGVNRNSAPGIKPKDLIGIPWMVAFALRADGWYFRCDIIWHKKNPMPESVRDRPTKAHEYIFLFSKNRNYYYDYNAIKEKKKTTEGRPSGVVRDRIYDYDSKQKKIGRHKTTKEKIEREKKHLNIDQTSVNKRSVWPTSTQPYTESHYAVFPAKLITPCILAGSRINDIIFDPFMGSGTTALTSINLNRKYLGIEIDPKNSKLQDNRLQQLRMEI